MKLAETEYRVMNLIWADEGISAKNLAEALGKSIGWSKTTTYTMVGRCVDKGLIRREEPDYLCVPCLSRNDNTRAETDRLIDTEYGGSVDLLMTALIGQGRLSAGQLKALYETLDRMEDDA